MLKELVSSGFLAKSGEEGSMFGWCRDAGLGDLGCLEQITASRDCDTPSSGLLRSLCLPQAVSGKQHRGQCFSVFQIVAKHFSSSLSALLLETHSPVLVTPKPKSSNKKELTRARGEHPTKRKIVIPMKG